MNRVTKFSTFCLAVAVLAQQPPVRPQQPPPYQPTVDETRAVEAKTEELESIVRALKSKHVDEACWRILRFTRKLAAGWWNSRILTSRWTASNPTPEEVHSPFRCLKRASEAVADDNLKVFEEIGLHFARCLQSCPKEHMWTIPQGPDPQGIYPVRRHK